MGKRSTRTEASRLSVLHRLGSVLAVILTPLVWPIGVLLLWVSPAWTRRDKLIGTLVLPGGLLFAWVLATGVRTACKDPRTGAPIATGQPGCPAPLIYSLVHPTPSWEFNHIFGSLVFTFSIALPILVAVYLVRRSSKRVHKVATELAV
jgi:hypothetical protein